MESGFLSHKRIRCNVGNESLQGMFLKKKRPKEAEKEHLENNGKFKMTFRVENDGHIEWATTLSPRNIHQ